MNKGGDEDSGVIFYDKSVITEIVTSDEEHLIEIRKKKKRGIIYLATIPPYMNVTRIRSLFGEYGIIGRVYLQLAETDFKPGQTVKPRKKKIAKKFTEGWVEYERKSVAKRVAQMLNNTQVSTRKKSKQYDCMWSIKYLPRFKWTHLHERLSFERTTKRQKLMAEVQLAKKNSNYFSNNLDKHHKNKRFVNTDLLENREETKVDLENPVDGFDSDEDRKNFLKRIFLKM